MKSYLFDKRGILIKMNFIHFLLLHLFILLTIKNAYAQNDLLESVPAENSDADIHFIFSRQTLSYADSSFQTVSDGTWGPNDSGAALWEQFVNNEWIASDPPPVNTSFPVYIRNVITLADSVSARKIFIENGGQLKTDTFPHYIYEMTVRNGGKYYKENSRVRVDASGIIEWEDGAELYFTHSDEIPLSTSFWNGTEKFHSGSTVILKQVTSASGKFQFLSDTTDVSPYDNALFSRLIIDLEDDSSSLILVPEDFHQSFTSENLFLRRAPEPVVFSESSFYASILGDIIQENTFNSSFILWKGEGSGNLQIGGSIILNGNSDFILNHSDTARTGILIVEVERDILVNEGNLLADAGTSAQDTTRIIIKGHLSVEENALLASLNPHLNGEVRFGGDATRQIQTVDIASEAPNENQYLNFIVEQGAFVQLINRDLELGKNSMMKILSGGKFHFGFKDTIPLNVTISGNQSGTGFDLDAGGYLYITSPEGIWKDSSAGNIRVTPSYTTISPWATFHYVGMADQVTGNGLGAGSAGKAVIVDLADNTLTLRPSVSFGITDNDTLNVNNEQGGILDIRSGRFEETDTTYITGSTGGLRMAPGTYYKIIHNTTDSSDYVPRLKGLNNEYELSPGSTIEFAGNTFQLVRGSRNYANMTFSGEGYKTISSSITDIAGTVYITDRAVLDSRNRKFGGAGTNLKMDLNAVFRTGGTGTKPDPRGTYTLTDSSVIVFTNSNSTSLQTVRLRKTYRHIIIEGNMVGNNSVSTGIKIQEGGSFRIKDTAVFKLKNRDGFYGLSASAISNANQPLIIIDSASTVDYIGSDQVITDAPYYHLNLSGAGTDTLAENEISLQGNLFVGENVTLHIQDHKTLIIGGDIENSGKIQLEHAGSLVQTSETPFISPGHYELKKTVAHLAHFYDYVYWSSPLNSSAFTMNDLIPNAWARYKFDASLQDPAVEPNPGWVAVAPSDTFEPARGYAISAPAGFSGGELNVVFSVTNEAFHTGTIQIPVSINGSGGEDFDDFNFLGNPYPSAIDFQKWIADNPFIQGYYGVWTNCAGLDSTGRHQAQGYTVYSVESGATAACSGSGLSAGRYISSAQGFMVEANQSGNVVFKNAHRVPGNINFIGRETAKNRLWVDLSGEDTPVFREILIGFFEGATDGRDRLFDAPAIELPVATLSSLSEGKKYVIQGLPAWTGEPRTVPLGLSIQAEGNYTLHIRRTEGILNEIDIYLHDTSNGLYHDLKQSDYRIYLTAGNYDGRFKLVFQPRTLSSEEAALEDIRIHRQRTKWFIRSDDIIDRVEVWDISGRKINRSRRAGDAGNTHVVNMETFPTGIYVFHIFFADGKQHAVKIIH